jgi:hypothetical protein
MMNRILTASAATLLAAGLSQAAPPLTGDYVEVRTGNVYTGACHFGAETTSLGREAMVVWRVRSGAWNGTDLSGTTALAAISAADNLGNAKAARKSVLYVDAKATPAQREALRAALTEKYGSVLGEVSAVKPAPITYTKSDKGISVAAGDFARIRASALPNRECCTMPHNVWYEPLAPVKDRVVGFTTANSYRDRATLKTSWSRDRENSAYIGTFSL